MRLIARNANRRSSQRSNSFGSNFARSSACSTARIAFRAPRSRHPSPLCPVRSVPARVARGAAAAGKRPGAPAGSRPRPTDRRARPRMIRDDLFALHHRLSARRQLLLLARHHREARQFRRERAGRNRRPPPPRRHARARPRACVPGCARRRKHCCVATARLSAPA